MLTPNGVKFYPLRLRAEEARKIEYALPIGVVPDLRNVVVCAFLLTRLLFGYWYEAHSTQISDCSCNFGCLEPVCLLVVDEPPAGCVGTRADEPRNCGGLANRKSAFTVDFGWQLREP